MTPGHEPPASRSHTSTLAADRVMESISGSLREILDAIPDPIYVKTRSHRWVFVNEAFCCLHTAVAGQILGKTDRDLFPPEQAEANIQLDDEIFASGISRSSELTMPSPHEERRTVFIHRTLVTQGVPVPLLVSIARDITLQRQTEDELRHRLGFEQLLIECSADLVNLTAGKVDQAITHALAAIGSFSGAGRICLFRLNDERTAIDNTHQWTDESVPDTRTDLQHLELASFTILGEVIHKKHPIYLPLIDALPAESGEDKHLLILEGVRSLAVVPMIREDQAIGALGVAFMNPGKTWFPEMLPLLQIVAQLFANIQARSEAEEDLRRAKEKAEAANLAKTQFLTMMSHELRTPLTVIQAYGAMLASSSPGDLLNGTLDVTHLGRQIVQSSHHLTALIDTILDFSSIESGRFVINPRPVDLSRELEFIRSFGQAQSASRGITFTFTGLPRVLPAVTDPQRIRQVLGHVLGNAFKFTHEGAVTLSLLPHGRDIEFVVSDTGIGMTEDEQAKVFEPFYQVSAGRTRSFGGVGLGLTNARRIAGEMGGEITLRSKLGAGTTVCVRFPNVLPLIEP